MAAPIVFRSTDSGAPTLSGTAGDLVTVLNACLTILKMFTAISGASFVDNTNKSRSQTTATNAGTFVLFQGPTVTNDEAYFGLSSKFNRAKFSFATAGVQGSAVTLAWEYWNGSAWTALSGVSDGTSGLTVSGTTTWTIPSDWATKAVNATTCYWMRLRFTAGSWTTNPIVQYATLTGWTQGYGPTSNNISYQQGGGNGFFLDIQDNGASNTEGGAGAPTARDARVYSYETMSAVATGTGMTPVSGTISVWRKSSTADATTRTWIVVADDRTVYLFVLALDTNTPYTAGLAGDFYSMVPNDPYRFMIMANTAETAGALSAANQLVGVLLSTNVAQAGKYIQRNYIGLGVATPVCLLADSRLNTSTIVWGGNNQYPNGPDGGLWIVPVFIGETTLVNIRGRLRGLYYPGHLAVNFTDGDTISGANAYAGKTFLVIKPSGGNAILGMHMVETSDTWETN